MKKYFYLYLVFLLPLVLIIFDKIFALESVKDYTIPWKKIEILFYDSKNDLLSVYQKNLPDHSNKGLKRSIILGTSRSGEFSIHDIQRELPDYVTYNFSAPFAGPMFHYYWLEKVIEVDPELSLVILEIDPILFSKTSLTYTLNYSLDWKFVWDNSHFFPQRMIDPWDPDNYHGLTWEEVETWMNKRIFYSYRYPPELWAILENRNEVMNIVDGKLVNVSGKDYKTMSKELLLKANQLEYGAIPNQIFHEGDDTFIKKDAKHMANLHFGSKFIPSKTQISFFKKIVKLTREKNINLVLYYPITAKAFRDEMDSRGLNEEFKKKFIKELEFNKAMNPLWKAGIWDPYINESMNCRAFFDSVHLSGACYKKLFEEFGAFYKN